MTIQKHIVLSLERLNDDIYSSGKVWQPRDYSWPADWEGRCLLALSCLNKISDGKAPFAETIVAQLQEHLNEDGYMGARFNGQEADEQQLSGHSWLLRGLMEYHKLHQDARSLKYAEDIVHHLFLMMTDYVEGYPVVREGFLEDGKVSGHNNRVLNNWRVSTDVGCVFISLDGLSAYYMERPETAVRKLIDKLIERFCQVDKRAAQVQTHAALTAVRGILRMYEITGESRYLQLAKKEFEDYVAYGMTDTYENFNWFERPDTWTEPCAVVDSFLLALKFWEIFQEDFYRKMARRIWFNGLSFCHRAHGGAGPNTCVTKEQPVLKVSMFEAPFCCTMRYCEGLRCAAEHKDLLEEREDQAVTEEDGRRFCGDVLLVQNRRNGEIKKITDICIGLEEVEKEFLVYFSEKEFEREYHYEAD